MCDPLLIHRIHLLDVNAERITIDPQNDGFSHHEIGVALKEALQDNWSKYASKAMPRELLDELTIEPPELPGDQHDE